MILGVAVVLLPVVFVVVVVFVVMVLVLVVQTLTCILHFGLGDSFESMCNLCFRTVACAGPNAESPIPLNCKEYGLNS